LAIFLSEHFYFLELSIPHRTQSTDRLSGAIMVLFLFVVMLMNMNSDTEPQKNFLVQFAAVISGGAML
jgi:hypothetical protein